MVARRRGFPVEPGDILHFRERAARVGRASASRLVVPDFAKDVRGAWWFIEAGPGSCAGTAHEAVFRHVAARLLGAPLPLSVDPVDGPL